MAISHSRIPHMKKGSDNNNDAFRSTKLDAVRQELIDNGMEEYADIAVAVLSCEFEKAQNLIESGVREGKLDIEDDVYALFNGMICQAIGMDAVEKDEMEKADEYLHNARSFFIMARDRGLDIPPVTSSIHTLNLFLGYEDDDDEYDDTFNTDAIDYLGFKKEFPKGEEFNAVLRMPDEDFSLDDIKAAYEEDWGSRLKSKKGRQNTWMLDSNGVSIRMEYRKCVETPSPDDIRFFTGTMTDEVVDKMLNPSVARVSVTALVGDESSYERAVEFTKVVEALLATHDGVSLTVGNKIRDPEETLEAIEAYPDDEWLAFILTVGFAVEGNAAMSNTTIVSDGMASFGFSEVVIRHIGPDDFDNASAFMINLIKYIFQFGLCEPGDGTYYDADGIRFVLKKHKKNGRHIIEVTVKH